MPPRILAQSFGSSDLHLPDGVRSLILLQDNADRVSYPYYERPFKRRQRSQVPPSYPELLARGYLFSIDAETDFFSFQRLRGEYRVHASDQDDGLASRLFYSIHLSGGYFRNVPSGSQLSPLRHFPVHPLRPHLPGQRPFIRVPLIETIFSHTTASVPVTVYMRMSSRCGPLSSITIILPFVVHL